MSEVDNYVPIFPADDLLRDINNEKIAKDITEGSKVFGDPEKLALRAAAARQGLRADRQHRLNERYYTDAYGSKLFHDAMDGNIVTGDPAALKSRAAAARQYNRAVEYVRQLRAANAVKAQAGAEANANAEAAAKAVEENPQLQAPIDVTATVMKALKADGNTSFANWRQSLVNQGWDGDPSKIKYDPSTGKFMSNGGGQAFKGTGKPRKVRQGRSSGNLSRSGKKPGMSDAEIDAFLNEELGGDTTGNGTYATAGIPRGGVVSPATMMRTSGVPPVQAGYGMNVPIGEEESDYTLTYDPKTSSMKPNDPYSYYDPSRNPPNEYIYDPITHELVRR